MKRLCFKTCKYLGKNKNMVMGPNSPWNQELLCWQKIPAINFSFSENRNPVFQPVYRLSYPISQQQECSARKNSWSFTTTLPIYLDEKVKHMGKKKKTFI
jgi:hypothetical protein